MISHILIGQLKDLAKNSKFVEKSSRKIRNDKNDVITVFQVLQVLNVALFGTWERRDIYPVRKDSKGKKRRIKKDNKKRLRRKKMERKRERKRNPW